MYKYNEHKAERIMKFGVTVDLPLFNQSESNHPNWLWNGTGIKADVYNKMKNKFAEDSLLYLSALIALGGNATDHEVKEYFNDPEKWPLHIVSARRNYFIKNPFYLVQSFPGKEKLGPKGKPNTIWFINYQNLFKLTSL